MNDFTEHTARKLYPESPYCNFHAIFMLMKSLFAHNTDGKHL